jgi:hypothetical protein
VPIFECPTCGKQDLKMLAACESVLDSLPYLRHDDQNTPIYQLVCSDCSALANATPPQRPVAEIVEGDLLDQEVDVIVNASRASFMSPGLTCSGDPPSGQFGTR